MSTMLVFIRQSPGWEHRHASGVDLYSTGLRGVEVDGIRVVIDDPCPRLCRGKTRHVAVRVQHSTTFFFFFLEGALFSVVATEITNY